jgi:hypothetical protein
MPTEIDKFASLYEASKKLIHDTASPLMVLGIMSDSLKNNLENLFTGYEQALNVGLIPAEKKVPDFKLFKDLLAQNQETVTRLEKMSQDFRAKMDEIKPISS